MSNKKFLGGLILGAAAGTVFALFLSSDKGKEVVAGAKTKFQDFGDEINSLKKKSKIKLDEMEAKISEA